MCKIMLSFLKMTMVGVIMKKKKTVMKVLRIKIFWLVRCPVSIKVVKESNIKQQIIRNDRNPV